MALKIAQSASQEAETRWKWSVWIEGSDVELDTIQEVTWKLHPTFSQPIRRIDTRATKFKLNSVGWGEFTVYATLKIKNGRSKSLQHWLKLVEAYALGGGAASGGKTAPGASDDKSPSVFLSYSLNNASLAAHLAKELRKHNYNVIRDVDIPMGVELHHWNLDQIGKSDAVVLLGADESGAARSSEVQIAQSAGVPVIPVTLGSSSTRKAGVSPMLGKIKPLHFAANRPAEIAPALATMIGKFLA
jgi:hypothetical protein